MCERETKRKKSLCESLRESEIVDREREREREKEREGGTLCSYVRTRVDEKEELIFLSTNYRANLIFHQ